MKPSVSRSCKWDCTNSYKT